MPPNVTIVSPPSENFIFDGVEWVEHGEKYDNALITIKEQKAKELNEERERLMNEGFEYMNYRFDSDASSATKINAAVTRALIAEQMHQEFSISWTTQDNSEITLNAQEMINLGLAYSQRIDDLHNHCLKLKKEIMTLETIQDVNEFRWRE